ncbi:GNAT family N-acetyltransferase [Paenibacillus sp. LHD-117]|uniref:GNAT family N-acetyltransferase n=1 Tax=Paenibacillus sp. LHD-117 TaxID=3071412 RepID=UPI0027E0859D|nr:GNAT family N-acetyltransferase [Paenibacillus sp. LHD-117]MDQ6421621.1 GNAT family N-acetyltransferase [Paenibacillus sp. LHD-117]
MNPNERAIILVHSEIDYMSDRMTAMKEQDGNPMGVDMQRLGDAVAYYSRNMPWPLFNHVKGALAPEDVEAAIAFYEKRERKAEFYVSPGVFRTETLKLLAERGYYQSAFHVSMYAEPTFQDQQNDDVIQIRKLDSDELPVYAEIHCLGTGLSIEGKDHVAANNRLLHERPGWHYYLGLSEGQAASVGVMFVKDDVASFTFAATLPEFRNKGLHTAMLRARLRDAREIGCRIVVAQCAFGSASHRNMERIGMNIGMTRSTWSKH